MTPKIWRGYHSRELQDEIASSWENNHLLYVGSPLMQEVPPWDENKWRGQTPPVLAVLTSGTTLKPRFVYYTKENIESSLTAIMALFDEKRINSIFCYPQPFHTFGLTLGYILAFLKGWELITPTGKYSRNAHALRAEMQESKLLTLGTPVHFRDLKKYVQEKKINLQPTYSAIVGGAPVSVDLWQSLKNDLHIAEPSIGYGCTEASPGLTHLAPGQEPRVNNEIGFPLGVGPIEIVQGEGVRFAGANACVAMEEAGELVFPEKILVRDDIEVSAHGSWVFRGRHDLVINSGGQKISMQAIEETILSELGLESLCFSVPDDRLGEEIGIMINSKECIEPVQTCELIAEKFQKRLLTENFIVSDGLPLNVNNKLDRGEALRWLFMHQQRPKDLTLPLSVSQLTQWTPHRAPMVWIDEVLSVSPDQGTCSVRLKGEAFYMSEGMLRLTSLIEFAAQSYAYVKCAQFLLGMCPYVNRPRQAFLVGTRETEFFAVENDARLVVGEALHIRVFDIRQMGPFVLFSANVETPSGDRLMTTKMKIYHT